MEYKIPFTQYMRPNGRQIEVDLVVPKITYDKAIWIINAGYRFEAEVLTTGRHSGFTPKLIKFFYFLRLCYKLFKKKLMLRDYLLPKKKMLKM